MDTSDRFTYRFQGGSLGADDPTYVRRAADDELYRLLRAGEFCYVLTSRQMGKSSLRVQTMNRLKQEGILCANVDLGGIGNEATPDQWYWGILYHLFRRLKLSGMPDWKRWWRDRTFLPVVQRLGDVIENVLLPSTTQDIVIFIDEIDSVISIDFSTDDFFAFIRACYGQRADNPDYDRLTFCLLGVATPSDLIQDKRRTPFNIGHAIELKGITFEQAKPSLAPGLQNIVNAPETVLAEILQWTGGQPFLTQKVCQLVVEHAEDPYPNIEAIIQTYIIENWEAQDEPEHLRTIRDRILYDSAKAITLIGRYEEIFKQPAACLDNNPDDIELKLAGIVTTQDKKLLVANSIYRSIFNQPWIDTQLKTLWRVEDTTTDLEQAIGQEVPQDYTTKIIYINLILIIIATISLYLHYGPFIGHSRREAFGEHSLFMAGLIEFSRLIMLLVSASYMNYFVWRTKITELWQRKSQKAKQFRWVAIALVILILTISISHNFWLAPASLRKNYHGQLKTVITNEFVEYILPSIIYFPYICIIHFFIAIPFSLLSIYAVTEDLSKNWIRTIKLRRSVQSILNNYPAVPTRFKHETIRNQFSKYALIFSNTASPYSTIFLGAQILWIFETQLGMDTLTEPGQRLTVVTYGCSFLVVPIFILLFSQYQRALSIASNSILYTGGEQVANFRKEHQVIRLLARIIGSNINLILLTFIIVIMFGFTIISVMSVF